MSVHATRPSCHSHDIRFHSAAGFLLVHIAALGVLAIGVSWEGVALCVASYYVRMFALTAGFHRYFAHRTYKLGRTAQFLLAFLGQTAAQKGVLWWASIHRHHHRFSDRPEDVHSPVQNGFWWSHIGWILSGEYERTDLTRIPDLAKFPELRWLDRNQYLATMLYAMGLAFVFGPTGLFYGYFLSTVLLWHGTFSINSVMHVFGRQVFATGDQSRNSFLFAMVTMGEGWHNNHHRYPGSAAQGFRWWQVDMSYYLLWIGEKTGIVRGLRRARERLREDAAALAAHDALDECERARENAATRLEMLEASYAEARKRIEAATEKRLENMRLEIEETREQLLGILERLVRLAESSYPTPA